jgi:hypothetical protein
MHKIAFSLVIALTPAVLSAQASARVQSSTKADAQIKSNSGTQASASSSVDAEVAVARDRGLPTQPIRRRAAEGRAKGATEAQVTAAAGRLRANLEVAQDAMIRAGRTRPRDQEVERGASVIERGYTSADIEVVARSAPSDRSLVVAFDVLTRLAARGVSSSEAIARVRSKLESRAPDAQISALVGATTTTTAGVGAGRAVQGGAASTGNAAVGAAANGTSGAVSATGTAAVTGAVGGVIRKP